ncbi:MAG: metallophosphoesterase family protein [Lachnospiraceae bacterium]|nr:metallophosphoesterase family protein [Lachnospiraceae bacterium]
MRFYIADCHFFHESLNVQMDNRGFQNVADMNARMLERWNDRVRAKDEVVILGDLSLGNAEETNELLAKLHGRLFLIRGNHDYYGKKSGFTADRFEWIRDYAELHDENRKVVLCHYPIMFYNRQYQYRQPKTGGLDRFQDGQLTDRDNLPKHTWMLYGHVHNTTDELLMRRFIFETRNTTRTDREGVLYHIPCQMINCFCMFSDYVPLTLTEWIENDRKRQERYESTMRTMPSASEGSSPVF